MTATRSHRIRRHGGRGAAAALAIAAVLLAGCAADEAPAAETTAKPESTAPPAPSLGDELAPMPADGLGLTAGILAHDELGVRARFAYLPGEHPFNAGVDEALREAIARVSDDYRPQASAQGAGLAERGCVTGSTEWDAERILTDPATGPGEAGGVAVVCDIVGASGSVVVERLRVVVGAPGGVAADETVDLVGDSASGELLTGEAREKALAAPVADAEPIPQVLPSQEHADCTLLPCFALSYDDGPNPATTPTLLDVLGEAHAPATFYVVGESAAVNGDLVRREADEGHEVGGHTWDHPHLTALSPDAARTEVDSANDTIAGILGHEVTSFRPPYGHYTRQLLDAVGLPAVLWSFDSFDWTLPPADQLTGAVVAGANTGGIVLMHDIHPGTVEAAPGIIAGLRDRGFTLVTVTTLFGGSIPPGDWEGRDVPFVLD